jgi:excisionase family DNA binding protein
MCRSMGKTNRGLNTLRKIMKPENERNFLSVHEVAAALGRSTRTVQRMIKSNVIKAYRLCGSWVISREDFQSFLNNLPSNY